MPVPGGIPDDNPFGDAHREAARKAEKQAEAREAASRIARATASGKRIAERHMQPEKPYKGYPWPEPIWK